MIKTLKSKYYTYVPGEFFPVMEGNKLLNRREFHKYKLARALWRIRNPKLMYYRLTHQVG